MPKTLTPSQRSSLRARAHALKPVVRIGDKGLTDEVAAEVDRALTAHELIKVKAATDDRDARGTWLAELAARLQAHPVQSIGKVLVLYRENPDKAPKPAPEEKPRAGKAQRPKRRKREPRTAEELIRIARRQSQTPSAPPASEPRRRRPRTSR